MREILLPTGEKIETAKLHRDLGPVEVHPENCPTLAFRCLMPKRFKPVEPPEPASPEGKLPLITLASFEDAATHSGIIVQKQALPREISADHWLRLCAMQTSRQIEVLANVSPYFADSKVSFTVENTLYAARFAIQISGGDAIILMGFAPYNSYPDMADEFGMFLATWKLLTPPSQPTVEPWDKISLGKVRFSMPSSWKKTPPGPQPPADGEAVTFANFDDNGELNGILRVATGKTHCDPVDEGLSFLLSMNLKVDFILAENDLKVSSELGGTAYLKRLVLGGPAAPEGGFEGWIIGLNGVSGWISLTLLTPPESNDERFHVWAFNRRALGIVCETIQN
jgi:hypothetical protein